MYGRESCQWCQKTKVFLKKHKIKFKDIDVVAKPKMANKVELLSGQRGVPVIDINGTIIVGFDEPELKKALKIK